MNASQKFGQLQVYREQFLARAEECAQLTIPSLFIKDTIESDFNQGELADPVNSTGARGLRNLAAKINTSLLPPNNPFFKYSVDDSILSDLPQGIDRGDIDLITSQLSRIIWQKIERSNLRSESAELFMSLLCTGNPLFFIGPNLDITSFNLNNYVIERDRNGKMLNLVVKETFAMNSLPDEIRSMVVDDKESQGKKNIQVYTWVRLNEDGKYESHQEICNQVIEESRTVYPKGINPWIAPRVVKIAGEHYGRSYVEEFLGDLRSLEGLSISLNDMAAASSRVLFMANPAAVTDVRDLEGAPNGSFIPGNSSDFQPLQAQLGGDFQVVRAQASDIEQRLAQAFLLFSAVQRNADRVTAEETRMIANELDASLGGIFSILSSEFQKPLIETFQWRLEKAGVIKIPKDLEIEVITGVDALGRGQDLGRLNAFVNSLLQLSQGGINVTQYLQPEELINRLAASTGIDEKGLVKSPEAVQQEQQQAMAMQALNDGNLGKALGEIAVNNNDPSKQPQPEQPQQ